MCPGGVPDSHFRPGKKLYSPKLLGKKTTPLWIWYPGYLRSHWWGVSISHLPHLFRPISLLPNRASHITYFYYFLLPEIFLSPISPFFSNAPISHPFYQNIPALKYPIRGAHLINEHSLILLNLLLIPYLSCLYTFYPLYFYIYSYSLIFINIHYYLFINIYLLLFIFIYIYL